MTIPGYATGVATVALVVVTAVTVRAEARRAARAVERDQLRGAEEAIRDARRVFAVSADPDDPLHGAGDSPVERIMFVNAGSEPIFNVGGGALPTTDPRNTVGLSWEHGIHQFGLSFLLAGDRGFLGGRWLDGERDAGIVYWMRPQLPVVAYWTHGRGSRWERVGNQEPTRVSEDAGTGSSESQS